MSPARTQFKAFFSDDGRFRIDCGAAQDRILLIFFLFFVSKPIITNISDSVDTRESLKIELHVLG